jgi:geranylgeranyl diphosphate synthase type II
MEYIKKQRRLFLDHLSKNTLHSEPVNLYEPIAYLLALGGKRFRPILTLMAADCFDTNPKEALGAAMAVEVFHNFTLMHDDIMDAAPLRRGKPTVHYKWNVNTAILSGDAMLIKAYQQLESYSPSLFNSLTRLLSQTALEVCEGQQHDIDFETRDDVSLQEYLTMITQKTAVLLGCALQMGAIVAKASESDSRALYQFGVQLGIAFQLQDDYLDTFGDPAVFGKQVGGDIVENKKTILYHYTLALGSSKQQQELHNQFASSFSQTNQKIKSVKKLFLETGAAKATQEMIKKYIQNAFRCLDELQIDASKKQILLNFGNAMMQRSN